MSTPSAFPVEAFRQAIESRDVQALVGLYADDAVFQMIDRRNPPSRPGELRGKAAIRAMYEDVCGRAMTHRVEDTLQDGDKLAYTETCEYPDGTRVFVAGIANLKDGRIERQVNLQAWDE
ncbi:MAG TPA: nuclear transport factor 2 family protein, partial [Deinococcales bacterium]|nr:nuclear transport factor 2 family protein [Deinococcales bacterium]